MNIQQALNDTLKGQEIEGSIKTSVSVKKGGRCLMKEGSLRSVGGN